MIGPDKAMPILLAGGYLERKDERTSQRKPARPITRLYDAQGVDCGVAGYTRKRLLMLCKIVETKGPQGQQRWILKC